MVPVFLFSSLSSPTPTLSSPTRQIFRSVHTSASQLQKETLGWGWEGYTEDESNDLKKVLHFNQEKNHEAGWGSGESPLCFQAGKMRLERDILVTQ